MQQAVRQPEVLTFVPAALCSHYQADQKRAKFFQAEGDHITLLAVYEAWKANKFSNPWCHENFIQVGSTRGLHRLLLVRVRGACVYCNQCMNLHGLHNAGWGGVLLAGPAAHWSLHTSGNVLAGHCHVGC